MIRRSRRCDGCVKHLMNRVSSVQYAIAPGGYAHLLAVVLMRTHLELIGRRELDLALFKFSEYIASAFLLLELVQLPQLIERILLNHVHHLLEVVAVYAIVQVATPQQDIVLVETVLLALLARELQASKDLSDILVSSLYFRLGSS